MFSLVVVTYVFSTLDLQDVTKTFSQLDWGVLLIGFGIYLLSYLLRTWRFRILLGLENVPFRKLFGLTSLYGMYLYLLPAKSGEVSYLVLLKSRLSVTYAQSTAILIVARFFDFATVAIFLPFVLIPFWEEIHTGIRFTIIIFAGLIFISIFLGLSLVRHPNLWQVLLHPSTGILGRVKTSLGNLLTNLAKIDQIGRYWLLMLVTVSIWLCVQASLYIITSALGYPITFIEMLIVSVIMIPMTLLPLQGFANLGAHEIGWTAAFALFGYNQTTALSIAVNSHIVLLLFVLALGAIGQTVLVLHR